MKHTDNEMCAILLSSYIGIGAESEVKPLSLGEWNKFINALIAAGLEPKIAYDSDSADIINMGYDQAFADRIHKLADRGAAVGFELQDYEKKGINVITEINKDYPVMLRRTLKHKKPPVLFYCGDLSLAGKVGIGVVGSRNVSVDGFEFTKKLVTKAAAENMIIYSGGAKGVDTTSESVALGNGGAVVSYIADSLSAKIKKPDIASNIASGRLLLLSDLKPDTPFSAGRAMNRNKYIYASAMGTVVVESDYNKGGTWSGAAEAMKNGWGNVFVYDSNVEGNRKLIEAGGIAIGLNENNGSLYDYMNQMIAKRDEGGNNESAEVSTDNAGSSEDNTGSPTEPSYEQMDLSMFMTSD